MRTHPKTTAAIALIAAAGMLPTFASSAQAQSPSPAKAVVVSSSFQHDQLALEQEIIARQVQLALLGTALADAANVTTSDRAALVTILTNEQSALATDAASAAAATTEAQENSIRQAVIGDERVYVVVSAQVGLVIKADNETVTKAGYTSLATELGPLVSELGSKHAANLLADVTSEVSAATSLTAGVSANALGLTPSGYPGNQSEIKSWGFQLNQAAKDLAKAKDDVKEIEAV